MSTDNTQPSESALALRLKQSNKYVSLALGGILIICILMFSYLLSLKQSEQDSQDTKQALSEVTLESPTCSIYPDTEQCSLAREIVSDPSKVIRPTNGVDGKQGETGATGPQGRGVAGFDQSSGDLIVTYTDGKTQNVGRVVGKDGAIGPMGPAGRGILSSNLRNGELIVNYTDGKSESLGIVVGPAGADGKDGLPGVDGTNGTNGVDGAPGTPGKDGISVIDVKLDATNTVQVYYSDGTIRAAGQLIISSIKYLQCPADTNVFTIGMTDGSSFSTTVDCSPDDVAPPAQPQPQPTTTAPPAATTPVAPATKQ